MARRTSGPEMAVGTEGLGMGIDALVRLMGARITDMTVHQGQPAKSTHMAQPATAAGVVRLATRFKMASASRIAATKLIKF